MKIGSRVKILVGDNRGMLGTITERWSNPEWPYHWRVAIDQLNNLPYSISELELVDACPCSIKACVKHRTTT